ncbi:Hypothetical predicted protein [Lecanosticta acicola]|uniref:Uncharacterized protein n=1 Tax=Lecanosticta acicola TaxID=111012 RepID=A0AAI8YU88_9PEZI|nr:Hypothetical predicted protein [Lecanosticta acicola]
MAGDDLVEGISRLSITPNHDGGDHDLSNEANAEARLQQEARMQQNNSHAPPLTRGTRDVTADFVAAAKKLPPGDLVKDENFTLFEAVGALEIMDPKMDSGYVPPEDSFEPDFDVTGGLLPEEVLWIMDEILRLEMSFHDGYPLSQNIFTSLHIFRLIDPNNKRPYYLRLPDDTSRNKLFGQQMVHDVLRKYCIAVVKCVECALDTITRQTYYEEEDFVTHQFGRELLPDLDVEEARKLLVEAMDFIDNYQPASSNDNYQVFRALKHRLVAREHILFSMSGRHNQWQDLRDKVAEMKEECRLVKPLPDAFSSKVTRQLATSTPPRPMPELSWDQALRQWTQLCNDVLAADDFRRFRKERRPHALQQAVWDYAYRSPLPKTYARAKVQDVLMGTDSGSNGVINVDFIYRDILELVLAGDPLTGEEAQAVEVPMDPRHRAVRVLSDFAHAAMHAYKELYRSLNQNRCRMRRSLIHVVLLFQELETKANDCDVSLCECQYINAYAADPLSEVARMDTWPLTEWTILHKETIIEWVLQLGFETEIYSPPEMRLIHATIARFADDRAERLGGVCRSNANKILRVLFTRPFKANFTVKLSQALGAMYGVLEFLHLVDIAPRRFEDPQCRYEARMKLLLGQLAILVTGGEYYKAIEQPWYVDMPVQKVVEITTQAIMAVKKEDLGILKSMPPDHCQYLGTESQWQAEIEIVEKVCVGFNVAMMRIGQLCREHGIQTLSAEERPDLRSMYEVVISPPGQRFHDWWPIPQIKKKEKPGAAASGR